MERVDFLATLKTAGLNLEATQLESVIAIQRLTILALSLCNTKIGIKFSNAKISTSNYS